MDSVDPDKVLDLLIQTKDRKSPKMKMLTSPSKMVRSTSTPKGLERLFNELQKEVRGLNRVVEHQSVQILNMSR